MIDLNNETEEKIIVRLEDILNLEDLINYDKDADLEEEDDVRLNNKLRTQFFNSGMYRFITSGKVIQTLAKMMYENRHQLVLGGIAIAAGVAALGTIGPILAPVIAAAGPAMATVGTGIAEVFGVLCSIIFCWWHRGNYSNILTGKCSYKHRPFSNSIFCCWT